MAFITNDPPLMGSGGAAAANPAPPNGGQGGFVTSDPPLIPGQTPQAIPSLTPLIDQASQLGTPAAESWPNPYDPSDPTKIAAAAKNPEFSPTTLVAPLAASGEITPRGQTALDFAGKVQQYRDTNGVNTPLDLARQAIVNHPIDTSVAAGQGLWSMAKGGMGVLTNIADAGGAGIAGGLLKLAGSPRADAELAQAKADLLGLQSAYEAGSVPIANIAREGWNALAADPTQAPTLTDTENNLLARAAFAQQSQDALQGHTALAPNTSFPQLQEQGALTAPTPAQVGDMSTILNVGTPLAEVGGLAGGAALRGLRAVNPENIGAFVAANSGPAEGALAQRAAEGVWSGASKLGDLAAQIPSKVVGGTLAATGKVGQVATALASHPAVQAIPPIIGSATALGARMAGGEAMDGGILDEMLGAAGFVGLRKVAKLRPYFDKVADAGADYWKNGFGFDMSNPLVTAAGKALAPALWGAGGALAFSAPFLSQNETLDQAENTVGPAEAIGTGMGLAGHTFNPESPYYFPAAMADAYFSAGKDSKLAGNLDASYRPYPDTINLRPQPGQPPVSLDAIHQDTVADLPMSEQENINRARDLIGPGRHLYVMPDDQVGPIYQQLTGKLAPAGGADGVLIPPREGAPAIALAGKSRMAMGHEVGHVVQDVVRNTEPAAYEAWQNDALENKQPELRQLATEYNRRMVRTPGWQPISAIDDPRLLSEYFSEQAQATLQSKGWSNIGTPDSLSTRMLGMVGRWMERLMPRAQSVDSATVLGVKPSFVSDAFMRSWLNRFQNLKEQTHEPNAATPAIDGQEAGQPESAKDPFDAAVAVQGKIQAAERDAQQSPPAGARRRAPGAVARSPALDFIWATQTASQLRSEGKLSGRNAVGDYLDGHLADSPVWSALTPEEKAAVIDMTIYAPNSLRALWGATGEPGGGFHAEHREPFGGTSEELAEGPTSEEPVPPPASGVAPQEVAPENPESAPAPMGVPVGEIVRNTPPNIRVQPGVGPKASTEGFTRTVDEATGQPVAAPGLRPGTSRKLVDGQISEQPNGTLVGSQLNPENPQEAALASKMAEESGDAVRFLNNLRELKPGRNLSFAYDSAESNLPGSPTNSERTQAQKESDVGMAGRTPVQKNGVFVGLTVRPEKEEPVFDHQSLLNAKRKLKGYYAKAATNRSLKPSFSSYEEAAKAVDQIGRSRQAGDSIPGSFSYKQALEIHNAFDTEKTPVGYASFYSPDKVISNAKNLGDALEQSNLLGDPGFRQAHQFIRSGQYQQALYARAQNMAHGRRGDGKIFLGPNGEDVNASWRDPSHKPVMIPDWQIQILNALEGGPSASYTPEQTANAATAGGRAGNPFWDKLKAAPLSFYRGKVPISGVSNILSSARETVRLDRIQRVHGAGDTTLPPSSYPQQAAAFQPSAPSVHPGSHYIYAVHHGH